MKDVNPAIGHNMCVFGKTVSRSPAELYEIEKYVKMSSVCSAAACQHRPNWGRDKECINSPL